MSNEKTAQRTNKVGCVSESVTHQLKVQQGSRDNPKMVGYGGLRDCYHSLGFSRLTHPTLMHIFSCVTAVGCVSESVTHQLKV